MVMEAKDKVVEIVPTGLSPTTIEQGAKEEEKWLTMTLNFIVVRRAT